MHEKSQVDQIDEVINQLVGPPNFLTSPTILGSASPRLDVSRPNIHDSKKEFLREKNTVANVVKHLDGIFHQVLGKKGDEEHKEMVERLAPAIDASASKSMRSQQVDSASDLALRNIAQTGFYYNSLFVVLEMLSVYKERLRELDDQEKQFWSVSNRAPNYYARTIASRLARLYAKEKRTRPTFGISREGSHPSTEFGRALEQVFSILGVKASVRNAAEWAIDQLSEEDWNPQLNALALGSLLGKPNPNPSQNTRDRIIKALSKGSE